MKWKKQGLIFSVRNTYKWMASHAQIPVVDNAGDNTLMIYFGTRDELNRTSTGVIEVRGNGHLDLISVHEKPVLGPGRLGAFDDSGAMPSSLINYNGRKYLYYIGWNTGTTVRYRNSIGLAVSDDEGRSFYRLFEGPIMDRTAVEPYFVTTPYVTIEGGVWRMWYCGCTGWTVEKGVTEPRYQIKYAESQDGIIWMRKNTICIEYRSEHDVNTRPCVLRDGSIYKMWYCYRETRDYRVNRENGYRIGYAESTDGIGWIRRDDEAGIELSDGGWDSEMIAYPYIFEYRGLKHLLYNGNGFGKSGFGYATLDSV